MTVSLGTSNVAVEQELRRLENNNPTIAIAANQRVLDMWFGYFTGVKKIVLERADAQGQHTIDLPAGTCTAFVIVE